METIKLKINGVEYSVKKGSTVLEAAKAANIDIPTLCYLKDINEIGACRMCLVDVSENGRPPRMVTACVYPATEGMEIFTNTPRVINSRKLNLELLLSNHERKCLSCVRSTNCELQKLCRDYGVDETHFSGTRTKYEIDASSPIIRDNNKCILCRRCVGACQNQAVGVIGANNRGFDTFIGSVFGKPLAETSCNTSSMNDRNKVAEELDHLLESDSYKQLNENVRMKALIAAYQPLCGKKTL